MDVERGSETLTRVWAFCGASRLTAACQSRFDDRPLNFTAAPLRFSAVAGAGGSVGVRPHWVPPGRACLRSRGVIARAAVRQLQRLRLASNLPATANRFSVYDKLHTATPEVDFEESTVSEAKLVGVAQDDRAPVYSTHR